MRKAGAFLAVCLLALGGCGAQPGQGPREADYISQAKLTEREELLLSGAAEKYFAFEYKVGEPFKTLELRLETYRDGKLEGSQGGSGPVARAEGGTASEGIIIFSVDSVRVGEAGDGRQWTIYRLLEGSPGDWSKTTAALEDYPAGQEGIACVWGSCEWDRHPAAVGGSPALAAICFSTAGEIYTLTDEFYADPQAHLDELAQFDVAYVLRCTFTG